MPHNKAFHLVTLALVSFCLFTGCSTQQKSTGADSTSNYVSIAKPGTKTVSVGEQKNQATKQVSIGDSSGSESDDGSTGSISIRGSAHNIILAWMDPFEESVATSDEYLNIKLKAFSDSTVSQGEFLTYINGKQLGSRSGEYNLFGNEGEYTYQNLIPIEEGMNEVFIAIERDGRQFKSPVRIIDRASSTMGVSVNTNVFWQSPDPLELDDKPFTCKDDEIEFAVRVISDKDISLDQIKILVNEKAMAPSKTAILKGSSGSFLFKDKLKLDVSEGVSVIRMEVGNVSSRPLRVNYAPFKPNLYVLSIGTKTNLQYTVKDAEDFVGLFNNQGGQEGNQLFNQVTGELLLGENAVASEIEGRLEELATKIRTNNIDPNDVILLFMSSHGFIMDGEFRLQGEDYTPSRKRSTSVAYGDMLASLENIPCKKVLFIDACHSGGAKANVANINFEIEKLNAAGPGLTVISSSTADEQSYEDVKWQNGAFTQALCSGLQDGKADANADSIITLMELYDYVDSTVPYLVKKVKNKDQHPNMVKNGLEDIPIFVVQ